MSEAKATVEVVASDLQGHGVVCTRVSLRVNLEAWRRSSSH